MNDKTFQDRQILSEAQEKGAASTLMAYFRLSGPGWLQSAITLGGGSLGGALYLGVIGGSSMLWLQLVAIIIGVIMLSAISYVTLSTGRRPYGAINEHVNPVLGVSWITATILANMIFILPQFSLCFDVFDKNFGVVDRFAGDAQGEALATVQRNAKIAISAVLAIAASIVVGMSFKPGRAAKIFDLILKAIVGAIVICFVIAVIFLTRQGEINWQEVWRGFVPDFNQFKSPASGLLEIVSNLTGTAKEFWETELIERQRSVMISTTATAVGINMTFLLPYSMLARGWDKPFRGLARWDLATGMAIPFIVVTSCIVLASANAFHTKIDDQFKSTKISEIQESRLFDGTMDAIKKRMLADDKNAFAAIEAMPSATDEEKKLQSVARKKLFAEYIAGMSEEERVLAAALAKPNTAHLAQTLEPVLGENANVIFGLGVLGMGFSTIIILMLINGYAVAEVFDQYENNALRIAGSLAAVACGFAWIWLWQGDSKTYLVIIASTFAAILLPIAYITFFALMNNRDLLKDEKPTGIRMAIWNLLMLIGVAGAIAQSYIATSDKIGQANGQLIIGGLITFGLLAVIGFSATPRRK